MHIWGVAQGAAAVVLERAGALCLRAGRWKLAFVPTVCACMLGLVAATGLLEEEG